MADARSDVPSLRAKLVGGVQWLVTGFYVFALGFLAVGWYLSVTQGTYSLSARWEFVGFLLAAFAGGYLRVALGPRAGVRAGDAHARRVEVTLLLLVLGFLLPFLALTALELLGTSMLALPFFVVPGATYAATLALSYGVVYGLDARPFLGHSPPDLEE